MFSIHDLSDYQKQEILDLYQFDKLGSFNISKKLNIKRYTVSFFLRNSGIVLRTRSEANRLGRHCRYSCDESFFSIINSEEKAYWLGFIITDGCVYRPNRSMSFQSHLKIEISKRDIQHLYKFREIIRSNYPIRNVRNNVLIDIASNKLVSDLNKYNIIPVKSLITKPPILEYDRETPFWRGCIDGDGSISYNHYNHNKNSIRPVIQFYGTYDMVKGFQDFIHSRLPDVHIGSIVDRSYYGTNCCSVAFYGKMSIPVLKLLYSNSKISLERKQLLANEIILKYEIS